uniref:Coiled-coil domain-containing protein 189-like n=1 Tax=Gouania willdenowi TaxID=441366 RepID=A0A8C5E236_GOUWI
FLTQPEIELWFVARIQAFAYFVLCIRCLCRLLKVDLPEPKRGVLLELYVQSVLFCREHNFSREQTSTFLSIIKSIHDLNVETPFDNIEQCVSYCKELLLCHSVRRPPFSINLFGPEEIKCVFEYIYTSYFKHFKLYKYVFTPEVKLDLSLTYSETVEEEPLQPHTTVNSSEPGKILEQYVFIHM